MPIIRDNNTPSKLTPDLYDIENYVGQIQKDNLDGVSDDTLMLGMFGYMREVNSRMIQNSIVMASEFANEGIATKAKFEKNVIAHALGLGITSLNAVPAKMEVFLTFIEDEIINTLGGGSGDFVFDCDNKIFFGDFEFHPDYDIIIRRVQLSNGEFSYTAMYDMIGDDVYQNPVSDITNPYLTPPVVINVDGTRYLFTSCTLRQVEKTTVYKKILSDNSIASKTVNFSFESQLAAFDVDVTNTNGTVHLSPIYEGLSTSGTKYPYVWYTYLDSDNIRIKFDRNSYSPRVSSDVEIRVQTTQGQKGNFTWSNEERYPLFFFESERLGYSNITVQVRPITNESMYGMDKKSVDELKKIIPKEALSRGSITNVTDLHNYFNAIDTSDSQMYMYKRRDNCLERLYYSYIVMKDAFGNVVPTNTLDMYVEPSDFETEPGSGKLILKRGQILRLDPNDGIARLYTPKEDEEPDYTDAFYYIIPYNFAVNLNPMYGMYFMTTMNVNKNLGFTYINEDCQYQYIATYINWNRKYTTETDTYVLRISAEQNLSEDDSMFIVDEEGNITSSNVECYVVFYNDKDVAVRWAQGKIVSYDASIKAATWEFKFTSNDLIDADNHIRVAGFEQAGFGHHEGLDYGYMAANTRAMIHFITYQPKFSTSLEYDDIFGDTHAQIRDIIPDIKNGWTVTNSYEVLSGIDFFYNYSEIIYSNIQMIAKDDPDEILGQGIEGDKYGISTNPVVENFDVIIGGEKYRFKNVGDYIIRKKMLDHFHDESVEFPDFDAILEDGTRAHFKFVRIDEQTNSFDVRLNMTMNGFTLPLKYHMRGADPEPGEIKDPNRYSYYFMIRNVPLIKYDYFKNESMVEYFCGELIRRKSYIDEALKVIEDSFGIDFKFFNTYGPSHLFTLDADAWYLNRVNLSLTFRMGLRVNYDENIIQYIMDDIKAYIEDIEHINSLHMSNLITEITSKYEESITFFEFVDMNGYGPGVQHLYAMEMPEDVITPELITVNVLDDQTPDIAIIIA